MRAIAGMIVLALGISGCGGDEGTTPGGDAGGGRDTGGGGMDTGPGPGTDTGPAMDTGPGTDTGPAMDAGPGTDTGPGTDSGPGACPGAQILCAMACTDVSTDAANCGACGNACGMGEMCVAGVCGGMAMCPPGTVSCGGFGGMAECRDVSRDPDNCGTCGFGGACQDDEHCADGVCTCRPGLTLCGTDCVDLASDGDHCGACDTPCMMTCSAGVCGPRDVCMMGEVCRDGCVDTQSDPLNCGGCRDACAADQICVMGSCEDYEPAAGCATCGGCTACPMDSVCCDVAGYGASCLDMGVTCP